MHFYLFCQVESVTAVHIGHTNDQFIVILLQFGQCIPIVTNLCKTWGIAEIKRCIFIEYLLIHTTVIFQDKHVVAGSHHQYVVYALVHQLHKGSVAKTKLADVVGLNDRPGSFQFHFNNPYLFTVYTNTNLRKNVQTKCVTNNFKQVWVLKLFL